MRCFYNLHTLILSKPLRKQTTIHSFLFLRHPEGLLYVYITVFGV